MNTLSLLWLIPALPLFGAIVNGIGAGKLPRKLVSAIGTRAPSATPADAAEAR